MPKRSIDTELNSENLLKYFHKAPTSYVKPHIDHGPKEKTPNNFYVNCLNDQYSQSNSADNPEDENKQISLIEVQDENSYTENDDCNNKNCIDEVRHDFRVVFYLYISVFFSFFSEKSDENRFN